MTFRRPVLWLALASLLLVLAACTPAAPAPATPTSEAAATPTAAATQAPAATAEPTPAPAAKMERLVIAVSPGPLAIPVARLIETDGLAAVAEETEMIVWENPDQLRGIVAANQADLALVPTNTAAVFYNRGLDVQLVEVSAWSTQFVVGEDPSVKSLADIQGAKLAVPFQGSIPDLVFQYIATKQGLEPLEDFEVIYTPNPQQAGQLLLAGEVQYAVLPEPQASAVVLNSRGSERELHRVIAFDDEWQSVAGDVRTPILGTVALPSVQDRPAVLAEFQRRYAEAVEYVVANPDEAGQLAERQFPNLGFKAPLVAESIGHTNWESVPADEARPHLDGFFSILAELSPEVIGGKVPDEGFYYQAE